MERSLDFARDDIRGARDDIRGARGEENQSIARIFMLTFYKIHGCVGTQRRFIEKKRQNVCEFPKKPLPLHSLS